VGLCVGGGNKACSRFSPGLAAQVRERTAGPFADRKTGRGVNAVAQVAVRHVRGALSGGDHVNANDVETTRVRNVLPKSASVASIAALKDGALGKGGSQFRSTSFDLASGARRLSAVRVRTNAHDGPVQQELLPVRRRSSSRDSRKPDGAIQLHLLCCTV
jgi:hypothetical protein